MKQLFRRLFRRKTEESAAGPAPSDGYLCRMETAEVVKNNTLMNGITSSRGEAMGFVQENRLTLGENGRFALTKELKSTKTNLLMREPVSVQYVFHGTYTAQGDVVRLSKAEDGRGFVSWGTFSRFLDTGDGEYDSGSSPGILSLYPTPFFVENCKNVPMTVRLNEETKTFLFDSFEPVILSPEEAGAVKTKTQKLDPDAGRMRKPLVNDMRGYSLKETYAGLGMRIGTCVNPAYLESPYEEILAGQFDSVTPENHLKPSYTLDQEKSRETGHVTVRFPEQTVKLLDWCLENRMPVRGHTLIWYMGTPEWLFHEGFAEDGPNVGRDVLLLRMEEYISSFFCELNRGGWEKIMYCIDVVNEAVIAPDRMRKCPWQQIIGNDYVRYAFLYARKYAPEGMKLCYNDFDLENKTDKVIELVNSVTDEHGRRLIDTVGQQGHYGAYSSISALGDALTKIGRETGCELQITELDVSVSRRGTDDELKTQGRFYYDFAELIRKLRTGGVNITGITLWGFADALSWMPSGYLHIYDRNLTPKYAYFGLLGIREYAGFDGTENDALPETRIRVRFSAGAGKYIELTEDGTFVDTTQGGVQSGRYSADGLGTFMLIPASGSYCNLILSADGQRAERVEAAGARMELVRETEA